MDSTGRVSGRLGSICASLIPPAFFEQVSGRLISYLDGVSPFPVCAYRSVEGFDPDGRSQLRNIHF